MAAETIIGIKACMKYDSNHVSMTGFNAFALSGRVFKIRIKIRLTFCVFWTWKSLKYNQCCICDMSRFRTLQKTVSKSKHYLIDLQYIKCIFAQYLSKFSETYFEHPTFQGVITFRHVNPGCRFACPGLCAPLGFQPALAKSARPC